MSIGDLLAAIAIIVSVGTFYISVVMQRRHERKQLRVQTTMALYENYRSKEMLEARIQAINLLNSAAPELNLTELFQKYGNTGEWYSLSSVYHFLISLYTYHEVDYIDDLLAKRLFRDHFEDFWIRQGLRKRLSRETERGLVLSKVATWLLNRSSS